MDPIQISSEDEAVPQQKKKQPRGALHKRSIDQLQCPDSDDDSSYEDSNQSDEEEDFDDEDEEEDEEEKGLDEDDRRMQLFPDLRYWVPEKDDLARKRIISKFVETSNSRKEEKLIRGRQKQGPGSDSSQRISQ
jgi:hypothetical protein